MRFNNPDGVYKNISRDFLSQPGKIYKSIFTIPGPKLRCVKHLIKNGNTNSETVIKMVEINKKVFKTAKTLFEKEYARYFKNFDFVCADFTDLHNLDKFDLVNLDTMSSLNESILDFIKNLSFYPNSSLIVNLCGYRNNYDFLQKIINYYFCNNNLLFLEKQRLVYCNNVEEQVTLTAILESLLNNGYEATPLKPYVYCDKVTKMKDYIFRGIYPIKPLESSFVFDENLMLTTGSYSKSPESTLDQTTITSMILSIKTSGHRAYVKRIINLNLEKAKILDKNPTMVLAGYKAEVTKRGGNPTETLLVDY